VVRISKNAQAETIDGVRISTYEIVERLGVSGLSALDQYGVLGRRYNGRVLH